MAFTHFQSELYEILKKYHMGEANAVHSWRLEQFFNVDRSTLQRNINKLRALHVPICSSNSGYFFAQTQDEIDRTLRRMNTSMKTMFQARDGLARAIPAQREAVRFTVHVCLQRE